MLKYFSLQIKKLLRFSPYVLGISLFFLCGIFLIGYGIYKNEQNNPETKKINVGVVGKADLLQLKLGTAFLESVDDIQHVLKFSVMNEATAISALEKKEIDAYLVFPDGFVDAIMAGNVKTINLVTSYGAGGVVLMFKDELSKGISTLIEEAQKGVYGVQFLLDDNGYSKFSLKYLNEMNLQYINFILNRNDVYKLTELGFSNELSLIEYVSCGLIVFLLFLLVLPFGILFIKKDYSINQLLRERGLNSWKQVFLEILALFVFLFFLLGFILILCSRVILETEISGFIMVLSLVPIGFFLASLGILIFEISKNILSGTLFYFFLTLIMCYLGGAFYPIFAFPEIVQGIFVFLPSGLLFSFISNLMKSESIMINMILLFCYCFVFFAITVVLRQLKIKEKI